MMHVKFRDSYKVLHMSPDRANIFYMDRRIKSSLKIGWVGPTKCHAIIISLQILRNIDSDLSWLLPILASRERIKCQIFVLDKDTEDLIGEPFLIIGGSPKVWTFIMLKTNSALVFD